MEELIEKFKKTDKRIIFIFAFLAIIIFIMLSDSKEIKTDNTEEFTFIDSSKDTDFTGAMNKLNEERLNDKKEILSKIKENQRKVYSDIKNLDQNNILKQDIINGEKFITMNNGDYFKISINGENTLLKNTLDEAKKLLSKKSKILNETKLPDGSSIIELENGDIKLIKQDGTIIDVESFKKLENGDYIIKDKNSKFSLISKEGSSNLKLNKNDQLIDSNGNVVANNVVNGNMFKNIEKIKQKITSAIDKNGCKFIQKKDAVYKICPGKDAIKIGKELFIDENGNIIIDNDNKNDAIFYDKKDSSYINKDGNLIFDSDMTKTDGINKVSKILKDKDGRKYIIGPNGEKIYLTDDKLKTDKDGRKYILGPNGEKIYLDGAEILTDKDGRKFVLGPNGEKIYLDGAEILTDKDGKKYVLGFNGEKIPLIKSNVLTDKDGRKFVLGPNGEKIYLDESKILTDKDGRKFVLGPNGEKIYLDDAKILTDKDGRKFVLGPNGEKIYLDGEKILTDKDGRKFIIGPNGEKIYLDDDSYQVDEDSRKFIIGPNGEKIYLDGMNTKILNKVLTDKNGQKYILDENGNKIKIKDAKYDKEGNLIWTDLNGKIHKTERTNLNKVFEIDKNGNILEIGDGNINYDNNGNIKINIDKYKENNIGFELYSFITYFDDFYEDNNGKIFKNNKFLTDGKIFIKDNKITIFNNKGEIFKKIKKYNEYLIKTLEFQTISGKLYKYLKNGTLIEINKNGKISIFKNKEIKIENGYIIYNNRNKEIKEKLETKDMVYGLINKNKDMITSYQNYYITLNFKNILNTSTYFKERTKLIQQNNIIYLKTIKKDIRYLFNVKEIKNVKTTNNKVQIDNYVISNNNMKVGDLKNFDQTSLYISDIGYNSFNFKNYSYITQIPNKFKKTKLNGTLELKDDKLFLKSTLNEVKFNNIVKNTKLLIIKGRGMIFKYKNINYIINKYGVENIGKGMINIEKNQIILVKSNGIKNVLGEISKKEYSKNTILLSKNGSKIINKEKNKNRIKQSEFKYVKYGEFYLLNNNKRVFYNKNMDVIIIQNMQNVVNKGYGQLVVINDKFDKKLRRLFLLQNGSYQKLGVIIEMNIKDNTIYKTVKNNNNSLFYITNNNINEIQKNILINKEMIPYIESDSLFGINNMKKQIFLGRIIDIFSGEFDGTILKEEKPNSIVLKKSEFKLYYDKNKNVIAVNSHGEKLDIDIKELSDGSFLANGNMFKENDIKDFKSISFKKRKKEYIASNTTVDDEFKNLFDIDDIGKKKKKKRKFNNKNTSSKNKFKNQASNHAVKFKMISMVSEESMKKNHTLFSKQVVKGIKYDENGDIIEEEIEEKLYLPIGTTIKAELSGGALAPLPTGGQGDAFFEDNIALFRISRDITLDDGTEVNFNKGFISAEPVATSIKRMMFKLKQIHYYDDEKEIWKLSGIKGTVIYDGDKVNGIPGIIIDEKAKYLAKATIYSVLEGMTTFITATKSPLNSAQVLSGTPNLNDSLTQNAIGGMGDSLKNLQDTIMAMVAAQVPMLVIQDGEEVEIRITSPILISTQER